MNKVLPNWTEEQKRLSACLGGIKKGNYFVISSQQTLDFMSTKTGHRYAACALIDYSSYGYFCPVSSGSLNSLISLRMSVSLCPRLCLSVCLSVSLSLSACACAFYFTYQPPKRCAVDMCNTYTNGHHSHCHHHYVPSLPSRVPIIIMITTQSWFMDSTCLVTLHSTVSEAAKKKEEEKNKKAHPSSHVCAESPWWWKCSIRNRFPAAHVPSSTAPLRKHPVQALKRNRNWRRIAGPIDRKGI